LEGSQLDRLAQRAAERHRPLITLEGSQPGGGGRLRGGQRAAHHPGGIATPSGTLAAGAGGNAAHHPGGTATSPALDGGGPLLIGSSRGADDADEPLFPAWYTCPGFDAYGAAGGWCVHHAGGVDRDSDVVDRGRVLRVIGEEDQVSRSDLAPGHAGSGVPLHGGVSTDSDTGFGPGILGQP